METLGSNRKTRGGGGSGQVGFRFHPTGEELVNHYLKLKKQDKDFKAENIPEVDVCNFDPGHLAARMPSDDMEWYFFGRKDYKYKNSTRSNRTTPGGYWKITGKERVIKAPRSKAVIGKKRTLTFYRRCEPKPKKTNWVMHEHDLIDSEANPNPKLPQKDFVICRMKKKSDEEDTSISEVELGSCSVSNVEDHAAAVVTPGSQDNSSSTPLSSGYIELEDVLQANGTNDDCNVMQSPFGDNNYSYTNKNDISTCDEGEPHSFTVSDFENEAPQNMSHEFCAQSQKDMDSLRLHVAQESPTYVMSKNNVSTCGDDEQFRNAVSNFENQATTKRISEVCPPPEEDLEFFFYLPQLEDYTLPMKTTVGDVLHDREKRSEGYTAANGCNLASKMCPMNMAVLQFGKQNVPHEHDSAITTLRGEEEIDIELSELIEDEKRIEKSKLEAGGGHLGKSGRVSGSTTGRSKTKLGFGQKRNNAMDTKKSVFPNGIGNKATLEDLLHGPTSQTTSANRLLSVEIQVFEVSSSPPEIPKCYVFESIDPKALDSFILHASKDPLLIHLPNYGREFGIEPKIKDV